MNSNVNLTVNTDKKGNSLLTVNGEVSRFNRSQTICVKLMKDNTNSVGKDFDRLMIATAPKALSEVFSVNAEHRKSNYEISKSGKTIVYAAAVE